MLYNNIDKQLKFVVDSETGEIQKEHNLLSSDAILKLQEIKLHIDTLIKIANYYKSMCNEAELAYVENTLNIIINHAKQINKEL